MRGYQTLVHNLECYVDPLQTALLRAPGPHYRPLTRQGYAHRLETHNREQLLACSRSIELYVKNNGSVVSTCIARKDFPSALGELLRYDLTRLGTHENYIAAPVNDKYDIPNTILAARSAGFMINLVGKSQLDPCWPHSVASGVYCETPKPSTHRAFV